MIIEETTQRISPNQRQESKNSVQRNLPSDVCKVKKNLKQRSGLGRRSLSEAK